MNLFKNIQEIPKDVAVLIISSFMMLAIFYVYFSTVFQDYLVLEAERVSSRQASQFIEKVYAGVLQAESSQRGYLLTGEEVYYRPYTQSREDVQQGFLEINASLKSTGALWTSRRKLTIGKLEQVVSSKFSEMDQSLKLYKQGKRQEALQLIESDKGVYLMQDIHSLVGRLQKDFYSSFLQRKKRLSQKFQGILDALILGGGLFIVFLAVAFYRLLREIYFRKQYETDLLGLNENLEKTIEERTRALEVEKLALVNSEVELKKQFDFTQSIANEMQEGVYCIDLNRNINFINPAGAEMLGYKVSELIGLHAHNTIHYKRLNGDLFPAEDCPIVNVVKSGERIAYKEDVFVNKEGQLVHVIYSSSPLYVNDEITGAVVSYRDISTLKHAEYLLKVAQDEKEAQFKSMANSIPQLAWITDSEGSITWYNQRWYDYTGTTFEEMQGWGWQSVHHPDEVDRVVKNIKFAFDNKLVWEDTFPLRSKNGDYRWFLSRAVPIEDVNGNVTSWFGTNTDITELRDAQSSLIESEARLRTMSEALPQILWTATADGFLDYINQRWYDYSGSAPEASLGDRWVDFVHPDDKERASEQWSQSIKTGEIYNIEFRLRDVMGQYGWFLVRALPIRDTESNEILNWFGSCTDVDEIVRARAVLAEAQEELERQVNIRTSELQAVNKELEAFSYSISHDLRSPLRSIAGFSQALMRHKQSQLDQEAQDYLNRILANTTRMGQLIDDILKLSRLTRGEIAKETVDLSAIVKEQIVNLRQQDPERCVDIEIDEHLTVQADPGLIRVVVQNLLENAWKFTSHLEKAKIEFGKVAESDYSTIPRPVDFDEDFSGKEIYFIKDNGAGFDMEYANKLFGVFQRLHAMSEFPGTGIGLATVQRIIHRHNGRIWPSAKVGKGAIFYFTL
jgi:PAS domain S-box-containing protein